MFTCSQEPIASHMIAVNTFRTCMPRAVLT